MTPASHSRNPHRQLVLIGGGHAHALVLKHWRDKPLANVRLTLISPQALTPYSGMLPGLVAGHYRYEDTHIDLPALCLSAGVTFIQAAATGLDLNHQTVQFADRLPLAFDLLSINTGITPDLSVAGAQAHAIPVKPIATFYPRWLALETELEQIQQEWHLGVVGGGAAGVELILALQWAASQWALTHRDRNPDRLHFHLIQKNSGLPENYPYRLQARMARLFRHRHIQVSEKFTVSAIEATQATPRETGKKLLHSEDGRQLTLDHVFWCTNAQPATWYAGSGLATDAAGYIATNDCLQSVSHPSVFASGDVAQQQRHRRARAGVFAVRQGPVLFENLQRAMRGEKLKAYQPQTQFLSLLACGNRYAMGCRLGSQLPSVAGRWVWWWKDYIDRRFMAQFNDDDN